MRMPMGEVGRLLCTLLLAAGVAGAPVPRAAAQEPGETRRDLSTALRAELSLARSLYFPGQPIRARLAVVNQTSEVVEVPLPHGGVFDGLALPPAIVFGTEEEPALLLSYHEEKPVWLRPPARAEEPVGEAVLRVAPHGVIGAEVQLTELHRSLRYSGDYRLEWRPLGGQLGAMTVCFRVEGRRNAVVVTDLGKVTFQLLYEQAPQNVENFLELVRSKFYDGKTFHRVVPGFLIQGGCPLGNGRGIRTDGKLVPAEFHDHPFDLGTLAMARKPGDPGSASCQFFICLGRHEELDGQYTVIGQARDEESLRTLAALSDVRTDVNYRPLRPLVIRFITLVDAEVRATTRLEATAPRSGGGEQGP
jgi:cyclophilin family peptidyl-prolyl cis-trans isomerase